MLVIGLIYIMDKIRAGASFKDTLKVTPMRLCNLGPIKPYLLLRGVVPAMVLTLLIYYLIQKVPSDA